MGPGDPPVSVSPVPGLCIYTSAGDPNSGLHLYEMSPSNTLSLPPHPNPRCLSQSSVTFTNWFTDSCRFFWKPPPPAPLDSAVLSQTLLGPCPSSRLKLHPFKTGVILLIPGHSASTQALPTHAWRVYHLITSGLAI